MAYLTDCTSSPEYDAWIDAQLEFYLNEEARRIAEAAAAIAAGILSLLLADRMFDIAEDAIEKEYEIRDRIHEIQKKYIDHWKDIEFPQKTLVCGTIYGLSAPGANYGSILSQVSTQGNNTSSAASSAIDHLGFKNRTACNLRACVDEAQMMAPVAIAQASHYVFRHAERQYYEVDIGYRELAASTHRGLEVKPDQVFALMGNATSLYSAIGGAAMRATSNATSIAGGFFGWAAGSLGDAGAS